MDHFLFVFRICVFSFLFIVALWSPAGSLLALLFMMFYCALLLSNVVSWVKCVV